MKKRTIIGLLLLAITAGDALAMSRGKLRSKGHSVRHRRVLWNPVLRGSHDSMVRQNEEIDRLLIPRIQDDDELQNLILRQELMEVADSDGIVVAPNLEYTRRYSRPWTRDFVNDLGDAYYGEFRRPLQVTSIVRTAEQQKKLRRRNRNAAPEAGDITSSHLAGISVDIGKRGLTRKQKTWLNNYLKNLQDQGLIEAAEERRQACFHIMVSQRYSDSRNPSAAPQTAITGTD